MPWGLQAELEPGGPGCPWLYAPISRSLGPQHPLKVEVFVTQLPSQPPCHYPPSLPLGHGLDPSPLES